MKQRLATSALGAAACFGPLLGGALPATLPLAVVIAFLGKALLLDPRQGTLPALPLGVANILFWLLFGWATLLGGIRASPYELSIAFGMLFLLLRSLAPTSHYNDFLVLLASLSVLLGSVDRAPGWLPLPITGLYLVFASLALSAWRAGAPVAREGVSIRLLSRPGGWRSAPAAMTLALALSGFLAGTLLYLFVPRFEREGGDDAIPPEAESLAAGRAGRRGTERDDAVTGFPTTVRIGDIGRIKQDERVAFLAELRVGGRLYDPSPDERSMLLLRARAWADYEPQEGIWRRPSTSRQRLPGGVVTPDGDAAVDWNLSLRAYDAAVLFLPQRAMRIRAAGDSLLIDELGVVTSTEEIRQYGVEAGMPTCSPAAQRRLRADRSDARLLALPPSLRDGLRARLGAAGADLTVANAIGAVTRYFEGNRFRYTLTLPNALATAEDPLLAFLDAREGHCELFASAGCLLLRTLGIPARLAAGLRLSERLSPGLYQARFRNAHAWVEIACEDVGMVAVDFTPPDSNARSPYGEGSASPSPASGGAEVGGGRGGRPEGLDWRRPFRYGRAEQRALARWVGEGWRWIPWKALLAIVTGLLLMTALPRLLRRRPPSPLTIRPPQGVPRRTLTFYARWLKQCARRGHLRRFHQTPREFLHCLPPELRAPGEALTAEFERLRYGAGG